MPTSYKIIKNLHERGNTCIGAGMFSAVMEPRSSRTKVIKVGTDVRDACLLYYKLTQTKLKNNPYVPKIYRLSIQDNYYICELEKLYDNNKNNDRFIVDKLSKQLDRAINNGFSSKKLFKILYKKGLEDYCDSNLFDVIHELQKHNDDIAADLGGDNVLFRKNGQMVFSDPIYSYKGNENFTSNGTPLYSSGTNAILHKWVDNNLYD